MSETSTPRTAWDEAERLNALHRYGILDTPREEEFDEITHVAAIVFKAPVAAVNFVEDTRQWFKAEKGLGIQETPIDISICASAIAEPDVFVVPDTTEDERFACNPLVTGEPHLRFYAGARIDTPEGLPLGTVCVLDHKPRPEGITEDQRAVLVSLARQATMLLELRRSAEARDLLGRELRHRIKNIFAIVGGLVSASSRAYPEASDFVGSLQGRLNALAKAQDYVHPAEEARPHLANTLCVHALVETLLSPYARRGERLSISGDDTEVGPGAATSIALIIHEQATNAVKYGSLSDERGRLEVVGRIDGDRFRLEWKERAGPTVAGEPERQGFGSRLAARSAAQLDGEVSYRWPRDGLEMVLDVDRERLAR